MLGCVRGRYFCGYASELLNLEKGHRQWPKHVSIPFIKSIAAYGAPMGRHGHDIAMWDGESKLLARHAAATAITIAARPIGAFRRARRLDRSGDFLRLCRWRIIPANAIDK